MRTVSPRRGMKMDHLPRLPIGHCALDNPVAALTRAFSHLHTQWWGGVAMPNEDPRPWEQQLREAATRAEEEVRRVVTYINDEVVPEIRVNGSHALRAAAEQLQKLAQRMDVSAVPPPELRLRRKRTSQSLESHPASSLDQKRRAASGAGAWRRRLPPQESAGVAYQPPPPDCTGTEQPK